MTYLLSVIAYSRAGRNACIGELNRGRKTVYAPCRKSIDADNQRGLYGVDGGTVLTEETGGGIYATGINADGGYQDAPAVTMEELGITTTITPAPASEPDNRLWIFAVCAAAVVVLGAVIAFAVSKARAKQTTAGTLTDGVSLTVSDTEAIVRKTEEKPSRDILGAVMEEIEK